MEGEYYGEDGNGERSGAVEMEGGEGDAAVVRLIAWAEANGAVVQGVRLRGRRFYASKELPVGHIVFSVPFSLLMTSNVAFKDEVFGPVLQELAGAGASDQIVLTLFLALEQAKGEDSFWAPFLAAIPSTFDTPLWFTEEELVHIQGTKVAASLAKDRAGLEQLVKIWGGRLLSSLKSSSNEYIAPLLDTAERAMQRQSLLWARTAVLSRGFNLLLDNKRKEVLVPLFDMLDHSPSACVAWLTDETQGAVHFACDAGVLASAEICNNYGQKPNDELLQGYGFCLYPNAADVFFIRIGLASWQATEANENTASEQRGTPTARQELLWRMGVAAEYQLSLKDPLPKTLFFAAVLCLQPESSAYLSTGIGWDLPNVTSPKECTATQMKVIYSLRLSLLKSAGEFAGGLMIDSDLQMLRCWGKQQDMPSMKPIGSEREKNSLMYRLSQKEVVQAALDALESYATVTLNGRLNDSESQGDQSYGTLQQLHHDTSGKSSKGEIYRNWMAAIGIDACGLSECYSHEGSRPALHLTKDVTTNEVLYTMGDKMAMCAEVAHNTDHPLSAALSKMKGLEESIVLRLLLLYESGRGAASPWAPFIEHLAYCIISPICYGPELLEALNGTGLVDNVSDRLKDLQDQYENIMEPLQHAYPHLFPDKAGTLERWLWADVVIEECALSVSISADPGGAGQRTRNVDAPVLVLAPILSTLPVELEGVLVKCSWDKSTGLLNVHSLCDLQAGIRLQIPSDELDNEACLLQLRPTSARVNNRHDVMELCIGVTPEDPLAEEKQELLQASGLGTVHYLTKDPKPDLLLAAVALCFIDTSDALDDCGANLLATVKNAKVAAAQADDGWCTGVSDGDQHVKAMDERLSEARRAHALAAAAALSFVQKLEEPSRLYKAAGTLRKLISACYKNLDGGSAEDDQKLLQVHWQPCTPGCEPAVEAEKTSPVDRAIWRGVIAYRHGQKQIMEPWMSKLKHMLSSLKEKQGHTSHNTHKRRDRVKRKR